MLKTLPMEVLPPLPPLLRLFLFVFVSIKESVKRIIKKEEMMDVRLLRVSYGIIYLEDIGNDVSSAMFYFFFLDLGHK